MAEILLALGLAIAFGLVALYVLAVYAVDLEDASTRHYDE